MDELLKHDFVSSKKGKRLGNVLLEKKFKGAKNIIPGNDLNTRNN